MSLLPSLISELIEDLNTINVPPRYVLGDLYDQHFGLGINHSCLPRSPHFPALRSGYIRPWRSLNPTETGVSSVKFDDVQFKVRLDVSHFKPNELVVNADDSGYVVVEGKHGERADEHGIVARHFTRKYKLPDVIDPETLSSSLSTDGVLTITATKKAIPDTTVRPIRIVQTNLPSSQSQIPIVPEEKPQERSSSEVHKDESSEESSDT